MAQVSLKPDFIEVTIKSPMDCHVHFRQEEVLTDIVPHTANVFGGALVMPNTDPPIRTVKEMDAYDDAIRSRCGDNSDFHPYYTLYLTTETTPDDVKCAIDNPWVLGFKLYPAGATTGSGHGVSMRKLRTLMSVLEAIASTRLALMVHGEDPDVDDPFDREAFFVDRHLTPLVRLLPELRITFEHVTTAHAAAFVHEHPNIAATVTPQHLLYSRHELFGGRTNLLNPHL